MKASGERRGGGSGGVKEPSESDGELLLVANVLSCGTSIATTSGRTKRTLSLSGEVTGADAGQWQRNSASFRAVC